MPVAVALTTLDVRCLPSSQFPRPAYQDGAAGGYVKNLAPGTYVLRHEIIALHAAGSPNGAQ